VGHAERLVVDLGHQDRHRPPPSAAYGTGPWSAGGADSALIRLRTRRARSAPMQSAVVSTPRAIAAAAITGTSITTIVDAIGAPAVARGPMGGSVVMRRD